MNDAKKDTPFYCEELKKPLKDIKEDIFFRADNFQDAPWYGEFLNFTRIGICHPASEHVLEVQKALKIMGYLSHTSEHNGKIYVVPGEVVSTVQTKPVKRTGMER